MIQRFNQWHVILGLVVAIPVISVHATPKIEMTRHSIGHSTVRSSGSGIELSATIGQLGVGVLTGEGIELTGGYWFQLLPFDCDEDGAVGYLDYRSLTNCLAGPDSVALPECQCFESDASGTIDLKDFAAFQLAFNSAEPVPDDPSITTVVGEVRLDNIAFAGALVELMGYERTVFSDVDGRFQFDNVPTIPVLIDVVATASVGGQEVFGAARFHKPFRGGVTDVGIIDLTDIVRWVQPADGLWSTDSHWEAFFPPGLNQSAVIDLSDSDITVTHDGTVPFNGPIGDLLCNERLRLDGGTLSVAGTFQMNNTLELASGTVVDTTIDLGPGASIFVPCCDLPVLDGVTINGTMQMPGRGTVHVLNGLTLNGLITMNGFISDRDAIRLDEPNRMIDGNGRIEFLRPGQNTVVQRNASGGGDLGVLTIGPGITIHGAGGVIGAPGIIFPASVINEGTIDSDGIGFITVSGNGSINNGSFRSSFGQRSALHILGPWTNNGLVDADGGAFLARDTWTNNGTLRLGPGPVFDSKSDFVQSSSGTFIAEIRSTATEGHGQMAVTGTATLDGVLRIEFENTFVPAVGQSFTVLTYGDHVGQFATIETAGLDPAFQVVPTYNATSFVITVQLQ